MALFKVQGYYFQLIATLIGCHLIFSYGILIGITPSNRNDYLSKENTPLNKPIDKNDDNWINLYLILGSIFGSLFFSFINDKFGRRSSLLWCGILQITSWFFIAFGYDIMHIYVSRICAGLTAGGTFAVLPVYLSEIAENQFRGNLGIYFVLFKNFGILFGLIITATCLNIHYDIVPLIGLLFSTIFTLSFPFVQETPYFHLIKNEMNLMEKSLRWFRGIRSIKDRTKREFLDEIERLKNFEGNRPIFEYRLIKIFITSVILVFGIQFSGISIVQYHLEDILKETRLDFDQNLMNFILTGIQVIQLLLMTIIADKINRKYLIGISSFMTSLNQFLFGAIIFLRSNELFLIDEHILWWITNVSLYCLIILPNIGLSSLSFLFLTEIFPNKQRAALMGIAIACLNLITFIVETYFKWIKITLGITGYLWISGGFCFIEAIFFILFVPDTRKKSFNDIHKAM